MRNVDRLPISAIVPVYNGGAGFERCLSALSDALGPDDELVVVCDGSTDGSDRLAEAFGARVLRVPVRRGPAAARNLGAREAGNEVLLFIDADVAVHGDTLDLVRALFARDKGLAAIIGSYDDAPAAPQFVSQYRNLLHHYVHQHGREQASTFWGACGAIRRDLFLALGGFDVRYGRPMMEDIELGYRLVSAGHRIRLCKELQVQHLKRWTAFSVLKTDLFDRAIPWTQLILDRRFLLNDLNTRSKERVSVATACLLPALLVGSIWRLELAVGAFLLALVVAFLNAPLYRFFFEARGPAFAAGAAVCHAAYLLCCGAGFAIGLLLHLAGAHPQLPFAAAPEIQEEGSNAQ